MNKKNISVYRILLNALLWASIIAVPTTAENPFIKPSRVTLHEEQRKSHAVLSDINTNVDAQDITIATELPTDLQSNKKKKKQSPHVMSDKATIEFNFEDADLQNLVTQVSDIFGYTFITDDIVEPAAPGAQPIQGQKISFKTEQPLTKTQAWNLFISFLDLARLNITPLAEPGFYRITETSAAMKRPVPTFIGTDFNKLPDSDQIVRYVYFVENSSTQELNTIIKELKGDPAPAIILNEQRAIILTDKSYNVKSLIRIIKELDKVTMPQTMSVLKLRRADAGEVKRLYEDLTKNKDSARNRMLARHNPAQFFPESIEMIAEPRTNALILFGGRDEVKKIEDFIINHVDIDLSQPYSPLRVYQVKFAKAGAIAEIMNGLKGFGEGITEAAKSGGVRGEDKYMRPMNFTAEDQTNRLIIQGDEDDYLRAKKIIETLDSPQPQVAIEVLIVGVRIGSSTSLGTQLRSKVPGPNGLLGNNVKFQTSGISFGGNPNGIVENANPDATGVQRLLGNLVTLINGAGAGNTVLTLGQDAYGVWGIFNALQTISNAQVVSNPFLVATNNTPATVEVGEIRRITTGIVKGTQDTDAKGDSKALLTVAITPLINSDGMIVLDLTIDIQDFVNSPLSADPATKTQRKIQTKTIVANREVLALGGLVRTKTDKSQSKTPILGNIPVLGWLFKNRADTDTQESLLILISTNIIEPMDKQAVAAITNKRIDEYHGSLQAIKDPAEKIDPVHRWYFRAREDKEEQIVDDFLYSRKEQRVAAERKRAKEARAKKEEIKQRQLTADLERQEKTLAKAQPPSKKQRSANRRNRHAKNQPTQPTIDTSLLSKAKTTVTGASEIQL